MFGAEEILTYLQRGMIKSIQKGTSVAAGTATITAVNTSKSFILSKSKASAGYVAARGTSSMPIKNDAGWYFRYAAAAAQNTTVTVSAIDNTVLEADVNLTGGTTALTVKEFSAVLTNTTTVTFDGAVEWQVIEFR